MLWGGCSQEVTAHSAREALEVVVRDRLAPKAHSGERSISFETVAVAMMLVVLRGK